VRLVLRPAGEEKESETAFLGSVCFLAFSSGFFSFNKLSRLVMVVFWLEFISMINQSTSQTE
jgi:hypothetical protein